jgi:hypothetical protein
MKKLFIILLVFFFGTVFMLPCSATPKAKPVNPVFEFSSLPEGENIIHEFIIRNTGDTPLNILNVLPP